MASYSKNAARSCSGVRSGDNWVNEVSTFAMQCTRGVDEPSALERIDEKPLELDEMLRGGFNRNRRNAGRNIQSNAILLHAFYEDMCVE